MTARAQENTPLCDFQGRGIAYIHATVHSFLNSVDQQQVVVAIDVVDFLAAVLLVAVAALPVVRVLGRSYCNTRRISGSQS